MKEKKKYSIVYKTTNTINNKFYIGVHQTNNLEDSYLGSGIIISNAIKKYGKSSFKREILFIYDDVLDAYAKEKELVTEDLVTDKNCYNNCVGGRGGVGNLKHTEEHKQYMSRILKGRPIHPNRLAALIGRKLDEESRKRISEGNKKTKALNPTVRTEESKQLIRDLMTGRDHTWGGKISDGQKSRWADTPKKGKEVICTKTLKIYASAKIAADELKVGEYALRNWLNGRYTNKSTMVWKENYKEQIIWKIKFLRVYL